MKQISQYILEGIKLSASSKVYIQKNKTNIYNGLISDNWKYDSWQGSKTGIKKIFSYIDKEYLKEHPCTQDELNYGVDNQRGEKSWIDVCKKCNQIAKIIETWPAYIIPKKRSFHGTKIDTKNLPGLINTDDLKIIMHRYDKKFEIIICDNSNNSMLITFKRI